MRYIDPTDANRGLFDKGRLLGSNTEQAGCAVKQLCPRDWHRAPQSLRSCRCPVARL